MQGVKGLYNTSYIIQFIKGEFNYGELYVVNRLPNITPKAFGRGGL
jgi:ATP:corrinoid adenosyltransferase